MVKHILRFFDKLEDRVRGKLSHYPILYSLVGAVGIILLWKGIWETADYFPILTGPGSILLGTIILLTTGLLVSFFIGDNILISGLTKEKKVVEKTEDELLTEEGMVKRMATEVAHLHKDVEEIKQRQAAE